MRAMILELMKYEIFSAKINREILLYMYMYIHIYTCTTNIVWSTVGWVLTVVSLNPTYRI